MHVNNVCTVSSLGTTTAISRRIGGYFDISFEMGRIDTDLMYDIVTGWDWGNSGSSDIYHDTQTRIQSVSYRGNLARLMEALLKENKIDKAKEVIEISLTNMPVDYFGYYTLLEPFVDGYYKVGETQKARELFGALKRKYQERLEYYASTSLDEQYSNIDDIIADMEAYRRNIDNLIANDDREVAEKETLIFNEYIDKFQHFYKDEDDLEIPEPSVNENPDMIDTMPISDTVQLDNTNVEVPQDTIDATILDD